MSVVPPDKYSCNSCGEDMSRTAKICPECKLPPETQTCKVCQHLIPLNADCCNECKSYQDWRRHIPGSQVTLSLLIALVAVLTPAVTTVNWILDYPSHTSAALVTADAQKIVLIVWNTGRKPSAVTRCQLLYSGVELQDVPELAATSRVTPLIPAGGQSVIELALPPPQTKTATPSNKESANVLIDVQESRGDRRLPPVRLPADFIKAVRLQVEIGRHPR
jgi:hypothetical protein